MRAEVHFGGRVVRCFAERPRSAHVLLEEALARNLDGEAVVCDEMRLTYAGLDRLVAKCAAGLSARGIGHGDRVAMLLGNDIAFPVVLFATLRLGAIAVPISVMPPRSTRRAPSRSTTKPATVCASPEAP